MTICVGCEQVEIVHPPRPPIGTFVYFQAADILPLEELVRACSGTLRSGGVLNMKIGMGKVSPLKAVSRRTSLKFGGAYIAFMLAASAGAAEAQPAIPDLSGFWQKGPLLEFRPIPGQETAVPPIGGPLDERDATRLLRGDYNHPNLQPWAAEVVKKYGDGELGGSRTHIPLPQEVCRPSGVPMVLTLPGPVQFLQTPRQVTILYQRDHQVRRIYLNQSLPPSARASPYGQSVGHYEGDTLVVTTTGQTADTPVDLFGTPHSEAIRVTERYRVIDNGARLEARVTVEDPKAFKKPWSGVLAYGRLPGSRWSYITAMEEEACAENNRDAGTQVYAIPTETRTDLF